MGNKTKYTAKAQQEFFEVIRQILIEGSAGSGHSENVIYIEKKWSKRISNKSDRTSGII